MIYIVIPVHNRRELTRRCLLCLVQQTYTHHKIIVVDDGSTDGTSEMIQAEFPDAAIVKGNGNLWWTEATNEGVRLAQRLVREQPSTTDTAGDFVLTLNDDTEVRPDYLQTLLDTEAQHRPCLVGSPSVAVNKPDQLEFAGTRMNLILAGGRHIAEEFGRSYETLRQKATIVATDSLPGRGTLIPMVVFDKIGLFDSARYAHYMADVDLSVRAAKAGYKLIVSVKSLVYEYVDATGIFLTQQPRWGDFLTSFTSIKSPTNLRVRYHFAIQHSKTKLLYFLFDVARICGGFLRRKLHTS